ncbi:NAD(P)H-dependent glycerol-3-phosphate dehydrogenase [Jonesia quinghaiensis]|uniref:NAD(P)H-dependent glycerol-3-phosphate dehydrogenase n=1 Tax=Jonesia quinghaiensis TaxID=262806 RepID=UPI000416C761|nr:NAD(P)H-dependent glycerol-3-phosphate dehydrogenase [Jonesia quinghaiensis]
MKATVLGMGAWGTTFGQVLADAGVSVTLWGRDEATAQEITTAHTNSRRLPGVTLPEAITATTDVEAALSGADLVVVAVPSQSARTILKPLAALLPEQAIVVSLMKGVELGTDQRMSEVLAEALNIDHQRVVVVSGPNLAAEIAARQPTATVVSGTNPDAVLTVATACSNTYFRPYTNADLIGVELCGAVKNVIAVAVGMAQGRGFGHNTTATIITRGLAEMTRLGVQLGADVETFPGLAGMGDLMATCASPLSRNHTLGKHIGQGKTLAEAVEATGGTAEGAKSCRSVQELSRRVGVEMPITDAVVAVLNNGMPVDEMTRALLSRPQKAEGVDAQPVDHQSTGGNA